MNVMSGLAGLAQHLGQGAVAGPVLKGTLKKGRDIYNTLKS